MKYREKLELLESIRGEEDRTLTLKEELELLILIANKKGWEIFPVDFPDYDDIEVEQIKKNYHSNVKFVRRNKKKMIELKKGNAFVMIAYGKVYPCVVRADYGFSFDTINAGGTYGPFDCINIFDYHHRRKIKGIELSSTYVETIVL